MKIFSLFIIFIFITKVSLAFDLKKLGDSLQKDLGGALKELEKGLNNQGNNQGINQKNNSKPTLENDERAVAKIINNLCVIIYTASNGEKFERQSTDVNNCERSRRSFLLNDAKQIEKNVAFANKIEKQRTAEKKKKQEKKDARIKQRLKDKQTIISAVKKRQENLKKFDPTTSIKNNNNKFAKNYTKSQKVFLANYAEYKMSLGLHAVSLFSKQGASSPVSERQGDKYLQNAFDNFLFYFYSETEPNRQMTQYGKEFPPSALHFAYTDNLKVKVENWKCYVIPKSYSTGKQPLCAFFWEVVNPIDKSKKMMLTKVWSKVPYRLWREHNEIMKKGVKRYVGDQLKISGDFIWLAGEPIGSSTKLRWESTLNDIIIENPKWEVSIEDAIKWNNNKKKWVWK